MAAFESLLDQVTEMEDILSTRGPSEHDLIDHWHICDDLPLQTGHSHHSLFALLLDDAFQDGVYATEYRVTGQRVAAEAAEGDAGTLADCVWRMMYFPWCRHAGLVGLMPAYIEG